MLNTIRFVLLVVAIIVAATVGASQMPKRLDEVLLSNGSRLLGTVESAREGVIKLKTDFAGTLEIQLDKVESLSTSPVQSVQLQDGSVIHDLAIKVEDKQLLVTSGTSEPDTYAIDELLTINPEPWELGEGGRQTGKVSFAWARERGNSDTDKLDVLMNTSWRRADDRYTLRMNGELDEVNGKRSADNWTVLGKYDYFIATNHYWGANLSVESNELTDLNLRSYIGPYYGLQWYERPELTLSTEFGLAYTDEDFMVAPDRVSHAASWSVDAASNYLGGDSRLYLNQVGIWTLDDTRDVIVNTRMGLAFPLLGQVEAAAELLMEYDSGAVPGVKELDQTYNFRIGYTW